MTSINATPPAVPNKFIVPGGSAAILYSLNLASHYIVYDGCDYWMVPATGYDGWKTRKPYRGHTRTLMVAAAYTRMCIPDLPVGMSIGYGAIDEVSCNWGDAHRPARDKALS